MFKNKIKAKVISIALILVMICPIFSFAQGAVDVNSDCSLKLGCHAGEVPVAGMSVDVYKIADLNKYGEYTLTEKFKKYEGHIIDLDNLGGTNGDATAETLVPYVEKDGIDPIASGTTNASGNIAFNAFSKPGMFLVVGHTFTESNTANGITNRRTFTMTPFLVAVPGRVSETNSWNYSVEALPKCEVKELPPIADYTVCKVWDDQGMEKSRPKSIEVVLMKDGKKYDSVVLNEDNDWAYKWEGLETDHEWSVTEKDIATYIVTITHMGTEYVITNTPIPGENPSGDDHDKKLPQTGLFWWPVLALTLVGLGFLTAGMIRRNHADE